MRVQLNAGKLAGERGPSSIGEPPEGSSGALGLSFLPVFADRVSEQESQP